MYHSIVAGSIIQGGLVDKTFPSGVPTDACVSVTPAFCVGARNWAGKLSRKPGASYWCPTEMRPADLAAITMYGEGLTADKAVSTEFVYAEIDDASLSDQAIRLDVLCESLDMELALLVFSGNKSLHAYFRLDRPLDLTPGSPDCGVRMNLQRAFCLAVRGDTTINDPARRMREPGAGTKGTAGVVWQPLLASSEATYSPEALLDGLLASCGATVGTLDEHFGTLSAKSKKGTGAGHKGTPLGDARRITELPEAALADYRACIADYKASDKFPSESMPCSCPFPGHDDRHPSAFVTRNGVSIQCSKCNAVAFADEVVNYFIVRNEGEGLVAQVKVAFKGKYIAATPFTHKLTAVKAPMGSGKTHALRAQLSDDKVLLVAHRQSIVTDLSRKVGVLSYLDTPKRTISVSCGVCINSIAARTDERFLVGATIVIDEASQVRLSLRGGTMKGAAPLKAYKALRRILQNAGRVVLLDAGLVEDDVLFYADMAQIDLGDVEFRVASRPDMRKVTLDKTVACFEDNLVPTIGAGDKVAIACTLKSTAHRVADRIRGEYPNKNVLLLTSDTLSDEALSSVFYDSTRKAELYRGVDVLIFSPVLTSGYSIDDDLWQAQSVWVYAEPNGAGVVDIDQMMGRVRTVTKGEYNIYAPNMPGSKRGDYSVEGVLAQMRSNARSTIIGSHLSGVEARIAADSDYDRHVAECRVSDRHCGVGGHALGMPVVRYLASLDLVVETLQRDEATVVAAQKARRQRSQNLSRRTATCNRSWKKIRDAASVSWLSAQELRDSSPTAAQRQSIAKAEVTQLVGEGNESDLLYKLHAKGALYRANRMYEYLTDPNGLEAAKSDDRGEVFAGTPISALTHRAESMALITEGLAAFGITDPRVDEPSGDADAVRRAVAELHADHGYRTKLHSLTGVEFKKDLDTPARFLSKLGELFAFEWSAHRARVGGKVVRVRRIDADVVRRLGR